MRYSKISLTKKGVILEREVVMGNSTETTKYESSDKPLASFVDAVQGFAPYFIDLLSDAVTVPADQLTITTLNFSQDKNGLLGLIVTGKLPVKKAYNNPLILNTPLVREGGDNAAPEACVLPENILALCDLVEQEAVRFESGETAQLELMGSAESTSENAKQFDQRAASAEVASTRKPRASRNPKKGATAADAEVQSQTWNIDKTVAMTTPVLRQLLLSVERDVPEDAIEAWISSERDAAQRWAEARQKEILGQLAEANVPTEPPCVIKASNGSLQDAWTDAKPPRVDEVGAEAIKVAAGLVPPADSPRTHPHLQ